MTTSAQRLDALESLKARSDEPLNQRAAYALAVALIETGHRADDPDTINRLAAWGGTTPAWAASWLAEAAAGSTAMQTWLPTPAERLDHVAVLTAIPVGRLRREASGVMTGTAKAAP